MKLEIEQFGDDMSGSSKQVVSSGADAYRADDHKNVSEKDLERNFFVYDEDKNRPVMEGKGMGGENFGKNNITPAGDDKNNPSQNAGYSNAYLARTEPMEEHPENSNFKLAAQQGEPDYTKAQPVTTQKNEYSEPQQGTVDINNVNIPGPNELPDQQKVGESSGLRSREKEHIET